MTLFHMYAIAKKYCQVKKNKEQAACVLCCSLWKPKEYVCLYTYMCADYPQKNVEEKRE